MGRVTSPATRPTGPPRPVRTAGALVAVQGLSGVGFAVALAARAPSGGVAVGLVVGEAAFFLLIGGGLLAAGLGLLTGRRWARTPAIVAQLLLLPVVYSLIGPSRQVVAGVVAGAFVVTTFLLLINERSREWSMGLELPDRDRPDR